MWDGTEQRKWREGTESLPEHDLGALYQAQHCESHKISKLQKAKREGSKSVAICSIPNCVYIWQIHTPKKGLHGETSQMGRVRPYWNQLACQWKDLTKKQKWCKMLHCNNSGFFFVIEFTSIVLRFHFVCLNKMASTTHCRHLTQSLSFVDFHYLSRAHVSSCKDVLSWQTWYLSTRD